MKSMRSSVRVLVVSGLPEEQYAQSVLKMGAFGYLSKDMAGPELLGKIENSPATVENAITYVAAGLPAIGIIVAEQPEMRRKLWELTEGLYTGGKLDRPLLRELVGKYGYADIAAELDRRDGWPLEEDFLTGGMPPDDYIRCNITKKQDWIERGWRERKEGGDLCIDHRLPLYRNPSERSRAPCRCRTDTALAGSHINLLAG